MQSRIGPRRGAAGKISRDCGWAAGLPREDAIGDSCERLVVVHRLDDDRPAGGLSEPPDVSGRRSTYDLGSRPVDQRRSLLHNARRSVGLSGTCTAKPAPDLRFLFDHDRRGTNWVQASSDQRSGQARRDARRRHGSSKAFASSGHRHGAAVESGRAVLVRRVSCRPPVDARSARFTEERRPGCSRHRGWLPSAVVSWWPPRGRR